MPKGMRSGNVGKGDRRQWKLVPGIMENPEGRADQQRRNRATDALPGATPGVLDAWSAWSAWDVRARSNAAGYTAK